MSDLIFSAEAAPIEWADVPTLKIIFGTKGATCLVIPRPWTLPFIVISTSIVERIKEKKSLAAAVGEVVFDRIVALADTTEGLIVRSSVVGESIWDRGTYTSAAVDLAGQRDRADELLTAAALEAALSAGKRASGLMIQRFQKPTAQGEFGNVLRVSKTRDHWEIAIREQGGGTGYQRLNSQRDAAASPDHPLAARAGLSQERLFGAVASWLNNQLLLGRSQRLNCEWIAANRQFYLVQIDEEDDDLLGANPLQTPVPRMLSPQGPDGSFLRQADLSTLSKWDKLIVLEQLWEQDEAHKPVLFCLPISSLSNLGNDKTSQLAEEFRKSIGQSGIIVRTSVRAGDAKLTNLPRTECLDPVEAANWCLNQGEVLRNVHGSQDLAFVAHKFVASKSSAWVRAEPNNPHVQINALWGLPDALQYCSYDIWEVHVPADLAVDYPDYKSHMLVSRSDGSWEYARVRNDIARLNCITAAEAKNIAERSLLIAGRLNKACHIMWFIGCVDADGNSFSMPWYWTEAHAAERITERGSYNVHTVKDRSSLVNIGAQRMSRTRQAVALQPSDPNLMRDNEFIAAVADVAKKNSLPVILYGSTLAHAYYQLRKHGCLVITPNEKAFARVRRSTNYGKIVRDKIPEKIAKRHELSATQQVSGRIRQAFLISKMLEEALEVREAGNPEQKVEELGDLFEVLRTIAKNESLTLEAVERAADFKREKAGGFEEGLILLQTGIPALDGGAIDGERLSSGVLIPAGDDTFEIPFSFFGFVGLDQHRSVFLDQLGLTVEVTLRADRIEVQIAKSPEQLSFRLDD